MDGTPAEPGQRRRAAERAAALRAMFPQSSSSPPVPPPPIPALESAEPKATKPNAAKPEAAAPKAAAPAAARSRRRVWLVPVFFTVLVLGVAGGLVASRSSSGELTESGPTTPAIPTGSALAAPTPTAAATTATAAPLAGSPVASAPSVPPSSAAPTTSPASPTPAARTNPAGDNLALRRKTTTSGTEGPPWPASAAVDGDQTTRWSSAFADPQWITVDLAAVWWVTDVRLAWEHAYGTHYRVDVSLDSRKWSTVYRTSKGTGGTVDIRLPKVPARYVRMYGTKRSGQYGYSLLEFEVR